MAAKVSSGKSSIWQWLTKISDSLTDAKERRQARLLLSLMLVIVLLGTIATLFRIITDQNYLATPVVLVGWVISMMLFLIARTQYYLLSGYALIYLIAFINISQPYFNDDASLFPDGLAYATVSLILSSLFTTKRNTMFLAFLIIVNIGLLPVFVTNIQLRDIESPIVYFLITSLLLILFVQYRDNLEQDRQAELIASEKLYRRLYQEKSALLSASNTISSSLDIKEVLLKIAQEMVETTQVKQCTIAQWDRETNIVDVRVVWPGQVDEDKNYQLENLKTYHPQIQTVLKEAQPVILKKQSRSLFSDGGLNAKSPHEDLLIVPLFIGENVAGLVELRSDKVRFDDRVLEFCQGLAAQASIALDHAQLYFQVAQHAETLEERVIQRTLELEKANAQLLQLARSKDEFVSNVSHELRTPITSIMLYNSLVISNPQSSEKYGKVIKREASRLSSLIEDLLRLSRFDQGREIIMPIEFDLNHLIEDFVEDRQAMARESSLILSYQCEADLPLIHGDRGLLGQVLSILLTNAMNYSLTGGSILVKTAKCDENSEYCVEFSVSDTGPGIAPEDQERLFERFYRGDSGLESGVSGTGLGLSIAKEIVNLHQGEIVVKSRGIPGQGTEFIVRLPVNLLPSSS